MRILTWNINSIRIRINLLSQIVSEYNPDIIMLQETKCEDKHFPFEECQKLGFKYIYFSGEKSYNGVCALLKNSVDKCDYLKVVNGDKRHLSIVINGIEIHNFYVPAGGDLPDINENPKFLHKINFLEEMIKIFSSKEYLKKNLILLGDLNIAPYEHDVWSSKQLKNIVSHTDIERNMLIKLLQQGDFIDIARQFIDYSEKLYSWWSYRNKDWKKSNRGRRLDHIWCSNSLKNHITNFQILKQFRDLERTSDHVPIFIDINI